MGCVARVCTGTHRAAPSLQCGGRNSADLGRRPPSAVTPSSSALLLFPAPEADTTKTQGVLSEDQTHPSGCRVLWTGKQWRTGSLGTLFSQVFCSGPFFAGRSGRQMGRRGSPWLCSGVRAGVASSLLIPSSHPFCPHLVFQISVCFSSRSKMGDGGAFPSPRSSAQASCSDAWPTCCPGAW